MEVSMSRWLFLGSLAILIIFVLGWLSGMHRMWHGGPHRFGNERSVASRASVGTALVEVKVPELSGAARAGEAIFETHCAGCHGDNAAGVKNAGPPLIHVIYEPSHHGDASFLPAVRNGVRAHHWPFGNMPPIEGVSETEVASIVAYVRELQRANGID